VVFSHISEDVGDDGRRVAPKHRKLFGHKRRKLQRPPNRPDECLLLGMCLTQVFARRFISS
jgi:hypothetical protein